MLQLIEIHVQVLLAKEWIGNTLESAARAVRKSTNLVQIGKINTRSSANGMICTMVVPLKFSPRLLNPHKYSYRENANVKHCEQPVSECQAATINCLASNYTRSAVATLSTQFLWVFIATHPPTHELIWTTFHRLARTTWRMKLHKNTL